MARITRKELKTDRFALEVEQTVTFFEEHRAEVMRYGAIAAAIALVIIGFFVYRGHQRTAREQELAEALRLQDTPVGAAQGAAMVFLTPADKDKAVTKAFTDLATKYSGTDEGVVAENALASLAADKGQLNEAQRRYQLVVNAGDKRYASMAKLSLAQIYFVQGRNQEGEALLRSLIANPTEFVSKEQATFDLARALAKTKPAEARKLIEPLRTSHSATISQEAIGLYAELSQ